MSFTRLQKVMTDTYCQILGSLICLACGGRSNQLRTVSTLASNGIDLKRKGVQSVRYLTKQTKLRTTCNLREDLTKSDLWQRNVGKETEKLNLLSIQNHNIMTQPATTQTDINNVQIWSYESTKEKLLSDLFRLPEMKKVFAHGHNVSETIIMIMYTLTI
ncbi:hypothetical protein P5673_023291 [Acropora cervicornis]|uniref:Uncharacterized protein n=1 Tax=Acropora cervicornis TaxID=6130 RepID=A0AAD9UYV4_ACRCE|nr:hypothetical protein P5673_023291 [Acropora cervicornis]